jgi:hypothetical protein
MMQKNLLIGSCFSHPFSMQGKATLSLFGSFVLSPQLFCLGFSLSARSSLIVVVDGWLFVVGQVIGGLLDGSN